jgi:hypothetical protein
MKGILQNLGLKHGTDKATVHQFNGITFLDIYEKYFNEYKNNEIVLMEIGILNGASLRVWNEFFKSSKIIGLDIDPSKKQYSSDNIEIFIGSQDSPNILDEINHKYNQGIDIIIDDGSHINTLTISSFEMFFPKLNKGGLYVIEDTHCTYGTEFWSHFIDAVGTWPGMGFNNPSLSFDNKRELMDSFFSDKIKTMDSLKGEIKAIHFYPETVIIEKTN